MSTVTFIVCLYINATFGFSERSCVCLCVRLSFCFCWAKNNHPPTTHAHTRRSFAADTFDAIIEKGTVDAVEGNVTTLASVVNESKRVLKPKVTKKKLDLFPSVRRYLKAQFLRKKRGLLHWYSHPNKMGVTLSVFWVTKRAFSILLPQTRSKIFFLTSKHDGSTRQSATN